MNFKGIRYVRTDGTNINANVITEKGIGFTIKNEHGRELICGHGSLSPKMRGSALDAPDELIDPIVEYIDSTNIVLESVIDDISLDVKDYVAEDTHSFDHSACAFQ